MLTLLTKSGSSAFDPIVMAKDGIKQSGQRRKKVLISLNPYAIVIDKNRREGGTDREGEEWWSASSNPHVMVKDGTSERSDTQKNTNTRVHS